MFHTPKKAPSSISSRCRLAKPLFLRRLASLQKSRTPLISMKMKKLYALKYLVMRTSRKKKLDQFFSLYAHNETVLDVGVSEEKSLDRPVKNYFLKHLRCPAECYVGLGIDDLSGVGRLYPGAKFVQYAGGQFPFRSKAFDWAFSNAVIEHVGNERARLLFINEMLRVAKSVFLTTPAKYFPVESHSNVFLLHWNDDLFYRWCAEHRPWLTRRSMSLFSHSKLDSLMASSNATEYNIYKNRFLGWVMTYTVVAK
jgi:hypothetical protein